MATESATDLSTSGSDPAARAPATRWSDVAAAWVLGIAITIWIVTFGVLVVIRQDRFGSFDFDMGIHDQSIWLLAHGQSFITVRGLSVFGHHATPAYYLLVPLAWLGGGPNLWNVLQVTAIALAAVPVFLLARFRTGSAWIGTTLGVIYLLHPSTGFFAWELFHPEVMAIAPLLAAYYCSVRKQWGWFALWVVVAMAWKEDVALFVVVLGLLIAIHGDRKVGVWTMGIALTWFLAWTAVIFPWINHGKVQSQAAYVDVGGTPSGMVRTALTHPMRIGNRLVNHEASNYYWRLAAPYAIVPLLAPVVLLMGVPQAVLNLITNVPWTATAIYHYAALPLTALTIALVEGVGFVARRVRRPVVVWAIVGLVLVAAVNTTVSWGLSPIGNEYRAGWWPLVVDPSLDTVRADIARIPGNAGVSASYNIVPHLSERAQIYSFPNPWVSRNYGIDGKPVGDPQQVDWLLVNRALLAGDDAVLFKKILDRGTFRVVSDHDDYVLARRVPT